MIDVSDVVNDLDLGNREFTVIRPSGAAFVNAGVRTFSYDTLPFRGCVQPATKSDLKQSGVGEEVAETIAVWSTAELRVGNGDDIQPDVIVVDGVKYRVVALVDYGQAGYWKAIAAQVKA